MAHDHDHHQGHAQGHAEHSHAGHGHAAHGHVAHGHAGHSHAPASFGVAFAVGTALNTGFVAAQIGFGLAAHSVALLADAVHNAGDVLGLLVAWGAAALARRQPTRQRTYGWGRGTILASLANAVVLLLGCGAIGIEAVQRFGTAQPVAGATVLWVAAAGIVVNGATALLFMRGRKDDLNIRGAFLHMAADAAVSAGVVVAGLAIVLTGWTWLDPAVSLLIAAVIVASSWGLLRDSVDLAMDAVPGGVDLPAVEAALAALPGVVEVHDLHVWALSTTDTALTVHLVTDDRQPGDLVRQACMLLQQRFGIGHATVQMETVDAANGCALRPAHVV